MRIFPKHPKDLGAEAPLTFTPMLFNGPYAPKSLRWFRKSLPPHPLLIIWSLLLVPSSILPSQVQATGLLPLPMRDYFSQRLHFYTFFLAPSYFSLIIFTPLLVYLPFPLPPLNTPIPVPHCSTQIWALDSQIKVSSQPCQHTSILTYAI